MYLCFRTVARVRESATRCCVLVAIVDGDTMTSTIRVGGLKSRKRSRTAYNLRTIISMWTQRIVDTATAVPW